MALAQRHVPEAPPIATYVIPSREQMPLDAAVNLAATANVMVETFNMPELAKHLEIVSNKPIIYVDCNVPREAPAPIFSQNDDPEPPKLALPSMWELITIWTAPIDDGAFATTPDGYANASTPTVFRRSCAGTASSDPSVGPSERSGETFARARCSRRSSTRPALALRSSARQCSSPRRAVTITLWPFTNASALSARPQAAPGTPPTADRAVPPRRRARRSCSRRACDDRRPRPPTDPDRPVPGPATRPARSATTI